jgi:GTP-binding protein
MSRRKAEMQNVTLGRRQASLHFGPPRGLIGYQGEFHRYPRYRGYEPQVSRLRPTRGYRGRRNGVLVSTANGVIAYALWNLEERGPMFIEPGAQIYQGMIIGAHTRGNDLDVNPAKGKQLTNIRTTAKDEAVRLTPPQIMSLEQAIAYIGDDELVEVTPKSIRLR